MIESTQIRKVELTWPGKDLGTSVAQSQDGVWEVSPDDGSQRVYPIIDLAHYPAADSDVESLVLRGDRLGGLETLKRAFPRSVRLAYVDLPRLVVDDTETAFKGDPELVYSTWLSVVSATLDRVEPLLRADGVVILHAGDLELPYARLLADERFRGNYVGTIVWQRAYAPRNMPGMKEFTATHDALVIYAKDREALPPVGLREAPTGYRNLDNDPRGEWAAEHKGAKTRRENSDFDTFVPPYRWRIAKGELPRGLWRLSPLTGVIWGVPEEPGSFSLSVETQDSEGKTARSTFTLEVTRDSDPLEFPTEIPWLFTEVEPKGKLRITTKSLPRGRVGTEYRALLLADGGSPFKAAPKRPGSGRYWEFAKATLLDSYLRDAVYLGRDEPTAIPHPKAYLSNEGDVVIKNQQTWWPGRLGKDEIFVGYTEDATKHLKALREIGIVTEVPPTAKPEALLGRLIDVFSDKGDMVLEVSGNTGDLAAVALKRSRRFLCLSGGTLRDEALADGCVLPRLKAVIDGVDRDLDTKAAAIRMRADAYIPFAGGGRFSVGRLGPWIVQRRTGDDHPTLNWEQFQTTEALQMAVLTSEGYFSAGGDVARGKRAWGKGSAVVLAPETFLTNELLSDIRDSVSENPNGVTLYYFRSFEIDQMALRGEGLTCKRVPFELAK